MYFCLGYQRFCLEIFYNNSMKDMFEQETSKDEGQGFEGTDSAEDFAANSQSFARDNKEDDFVEKMPSVNNILTWGEFLNYTDLLSELQFQSEKDIGKGYNFVGLFLEDVDSDIMKQGISISTPGSRQSEQIRPENRRKPDPIPSRQLPIERNNNVIKFLNRIIIDSLNPRTIGIHFGCQNQTQLVKNMESFARREKKIYEDNKNHNSDLQSMKKIYGISQSRSGLPPALCIEKSKKMRKMAHALIGEQAIHRVLDNPRIKKLKNSYLVKLKVIRLRLRSSELITRSEI